jgi:type II secretory pathway component PulK
LNEYLTAIFNNKLQDDEEFSQAYRDYKLDELVDSILGWADRTYESRSYPRNHPIPLKGAPFYSVSELHQVPYMDDTLFDLFAPNLTVLATSGINVNLMSEATLRALIPELTKEEVTEFFKFRDDPEKDNLFKTVDDFFTYMKTNVGYFRGSDAQVTEFRDNLKKRGLELVTENTTYRIIVRSTVRQATKNLEAWVQLSSKSSKTSTPNTSTTPGSTTTTAPKPDSGIRLLFMRIL